MNTKAGQDAKITGRHGLFIAASFASFFLFAVPHTIHGSNAPVMMEYYGITAAQQGFVVTMQSVGGIAAALFVSLRGERYNKINVIALGVIIICLSCAAVGLVPAYRMLVLIVVVLGIGNSFVDVMMNGVIADVYPGKKNTLLPITHGFFVLGAMFSPMFVGFTVDPDAPVSFAYPFRIICIGAVAIFLLYFLSSRRIMAETPYVKMDAMKRRATENPAEVFKTKKAWIFLAAAIMYITFQYGTNMWLPTYAIRNVGADFQTGALMVTAFFAPALAMRFLTPFLLRRIPPRTFYSVFGWIAAALMLAALSVKSIPILFILIVAVGFVQGSIIVVLILMCTEAFPDRTASASSIVSLASGIATLTAPFWMGSLSDHTGFLIPMIMITCCLAASSLVIFLGAGPAGEPGSVKS